MDGLSIPVLLLLGFAVLALVAAMAVLLMRGEQAMGRMRQMAEQAETRERGLAERLATQERTLTRLLEERLTDVSKRVSDGLLNATDRTLTSMTEIQKRLAVIDEAQKNISQLSTQMVSLQDILSNKQARGAFGEVQLEAIVSAVLPPSAYEFQAQLPNGRRADCLLRLPNPPGPIVIDAKFPLESYQTMTTSEDEAERRAAGRAFTQDVMRHVDAIAERYILPGETAESALMFLPSEAVYAELHAHFQGAVEHGYRKRVWIVSPTTCMATLNTVRAVLKDVRMREQAHVIQKEVGVLAEDVKRLAGRVDSLKRHFGQAESDIRMIETSAGKITSRAEKIGEIEMEAAEDALPSPSSPSPPQDS